MARNYDRTESRKRNKYRNRYIRFAEKMLKESRKAQGSERDRLRAIARNATERAFGTYEKSPTGKKITNLAKELGVTMTAADRKRMAKYSTDYTSSRYTVKNADREQMAIDILSSGNISGRVFGGLVDVWRGEGKVTPDEMREGIFQFLGVETWADALDALHDIVPNLYEDVSDDATYDEVTSAIMAYVKEHRQ